MAQGVYYPLGVCSMKYCCLGVSRKEYLRGSTPATIHLVQETRAQIWPNLAPEYICHFMTDSLSPDYFLFKSAGCQTVNFGHLMLFAFEKKE